MGSLQWGVGNLLVILKLFGCRILLGKYFKRVKTQLFSALCVWWMVQSLLFVSSFFSHLPTVDY